MTTTQTHDTAGKPPQLAQARSPEDVRKAGKLVARQAGGGTVAAFFEQNKDTLKALLPEHMKPERMLKIALGALRTTPKLMDCSIESLFGAVVVCSQLGLEPNTPQGHIYLIPFKNTKKQTTEVQIVIGYKGLIDLARRSGQIESLSARVVRKNDLFKVSYGTDDRIIHEPRIDGDRGPITGFYAVAKLKGGGTQFEFMSAHEVNAVRDASQGFQTAKRYGNTNTPWHTHYEEMGRKTLIRRLAKYLPMSIEMATAASLDERAAFGETQGLDSVLDGDFTVVADDTPMDGDDETGDGQQDHRGTPHDPETGEVIEHKPETPAPSAAKPAQQKAPARTTAPAGDDDGLFNAT